MNRKKEQKATAFAKNVYAIKIIEKLWIIVIMLVNREMLHRDVA